MEKHLQILSKARTLEALSNVIKSAKILPLYRFNLLQYKSNKFHVLKNIQKLFQCNVIVRSSSLSEDKLEISNAGKFESILNVASTNSEILQDAIRKVVLSYGDEANDFDEIFVQPMLKNVTMSGVIFSSDIDTLSSYYIINYDESGSTNSVTNGNSNELKSFICFKENSNIESIKLKQLITATKECENIFGNDFLDIEFAFSGDELYILQVRAIVIGNKENLSSINLSESLCKLYKKIEKLNAPHPNLLGNKTIFGVMPDWNPAEIIGIRPKMLAISLYKELITDETWAYQRDNYGYRNLRSHPLLVSFLGVPFIDARISFNSFIPKELDEQIATKLVNYYLNVLSQNISYHDKVEFEIIFSCYYFGIENKLLKLNDFGFNENELNSIKKSLLGLTNKIIDTKNGLYKKDLEKVEILKTKFDDIINADLSLIDKIYWLIKDVRRYGTLPFAGVARAGFIAVQILKSFVAEKILTHEEYSAFLNSLNTVSKKLSIDINTLAKEDFLNIYGHLRPGTYDILSARYDESYDIYFGNNLSKQDKEAYEFSFSNIQKEEIEKLIAQNGLKTNFDSLIVFIKESIEGREYVKFVFTKHLSQILKYIEKFGQRFGFDKEALAYLDIQTIMSLYATLDHRDVHDILQCDIEKNKVFYQYTKAVKLPTLIVNQEAIYSFYLDESEANFVTLKRIEADVMVEKEILINDLKNTIVCIASADPGYDYLFTKNIGGLITCYGGANSHMAIRCAEMGIPAVIGCGESNFAKYINAKRITIDALNKQVKVIL